MVWGGNKRLSQFANLTCVDDDSVESLVDDQDENAPNYNEVDGKVVNDIDSMMKNLSIQGCTPKQQEKYVSKYIKSFKSEASKRRRDRKKKEQEEHVRLAAEVKAREEEEERERLAAEAREKEEEKERERLVAEAKEKERERLVAEAKEERERLAAEAKKAKERERLAAEVKKVEEERNRLAVEAKEAEERERAAEAKAKEEVRQTAKDTTVSEDPDDDDVISISSAEYDDELDEAEQVVEVDDDSERNLATRFASAFNKLDTTLTLDFKPDDITHEIAEEYQKNCKARGGCSFKENGNRISKLCTDIRHTGKLRKKKLVIGAGRTSPRTQRKASRGKQQAACFVVCFDMAEENDFFDYKEVELHSQLLFGFGDDRKRPQKCLAFMELIKVVCSSDCDEIEVWFKSTLRVAVKDEDFLYYVVSVFVLMIQILCIYYIHISPTLSPHIHTGNPYVT